MDLETKISQLQEEIGSKPGRAKASGDALPRPPESHTLSGNLNLNIGTSLSQLLQIIITFFFCFKPLNIYRNVSEDLLFTQFSPCVACNEKSRCQSLKRLLWNCKTSSEVIHPCSSDSYYRYEPSITLLRLHPLVPIPSTSKCGNCLGQDHETWCKSGLGGQPVLVDQECARGPWRKEQEHERG